MAQLPTIEQVSAPVPPERELVLAQPDANTMDRLLPWVGKLIGTVIVGPGAVVLGDPGLVWNRRRSPGHR